MSKSTITVKHVDSSNVHLLAIKKGYEPTDVVKELNNHTEIEIINQGKTYVLVRTKTMPELTSATELKPTKLEIY